MGVVKEQIVQPDGTLIETAAVPELVRLLQNEAKVL